MKLIVGDRQSGRTSDLIRAAADDEAHGLCVYIVCHSQEECFRIAREAEQMELNVRFPITYDEFLHRSYSGVNIDKLYIDNLRMLLEHISIVPIEAVVW
jgi:hypothetical protein